MDQFDLDFSYLKRVVIPDNRVPVRGNEHRLTKVAFDMFRIDSEPETLWKIQADDDGNEFLVRTYNLPDDELSAQGGWSVMSDAKKANLTVSYKGVPIHRVVASEFGANTAEDTELLASVLRRKLASDDSFAGKMLRSLHPSKLRAVASSFPELLIKADEGKDDPTFEDEGEPTEALVETGKANYALVWAETGLDKIVEASSHEEAVEKGNLLFRYFGTETPEYDKVKGGGLKPSIPGAQDFIRKVGKEDSKGDDYPKWAEDMGPMKTLSDPKMDQELWVYPTKDAPRDAYDLNFDSDGMYDRHTRPTVEVPMVDVKERHTRPTSEHIAITPEMLLQKKKDFVTSDSFEEAFQKWLSLEGMKDTETY